MHKVAVLKHHQLLHNSTRHRLACQSSRFVSRLFRFIEKDAFSKTPLATTPCLIVAMSPCFLQSWRWRLFLVADDFLDFPIFNRQQGSHQAKDEKKIHRTCIFAWMVIHFSLMLLAVAAATSDGFMFNNSRRRCCSNAHYSDSRILHVSSRNTFFVEQWLKATVSDESRPCKIQRSRLRWYWFGWFHIDLKDNRRNKRILKWTW